jgi:hypothetical protein
MKADDDAGRIEVARLEDEIARKGGDARSRLEAELARAKEQHAEQRARREKRLEEIKSEWATRVASIQDKARTAGDEAQRRHEAHLDEVSHFARQQEAAANTLLA